MARKLPAIQQLVGADAIVAIVYGEVSSSLYFALGVVALWALGLTPLVLLVAGLLFGLAVGAYAEGVTMVDASGGSSAIARRAFGDFIGFVVGWAVVLDFIVVITLSLLFIPHYALASVGQLSQLHRPWDEVVVVAIAAGLGGLRLIRRARLYRATIVVAVIDIVVQGTLALLGLVLVFDLGRLTRPIQVGTVPGWDAIAYSLPLAMVAFAGIEIVGVLLREARSSDQRLVRNTRLAVVVAVIGYALIAAAALSAFPVRRVPGTPSGHASAISTTWLNAPLAGVAQRVGEGISHAAGLGLRGVVGISAVLVLFFNATSAFSGATRVLSSLAEARALPAVFLRPSRRATSSPAAIALVVVGVAAILPIASLFDREVTGLVSIYAFGILVAFMATFLAVGWLRVTEPELERPIRMGLNIRFGATAIPATAMIGFALSWLAWLLTLGTHRAARIVPPAWLAIGVVTYIVARRMAGRPILRSTPTVTRAPEVMEVGHGTIVVPVKQAGPVEEEMLATACKLVQEHGGRVIALKVIEVLLSFPLDQPLADEERQAEELGALAATFAADYSVEIEAEVVRARAISGAVVAEAVRAGADLILIGAVPRPGALAGRAHVFSDTVENLIRRAPCRVIVTAFPPGTASVAEAGDTRDTAGSHA